MKASDIQLGHNISILMKAPPGYGKTLAAASFAELGPIWMAYWDKQKPFELIHYFKNIVKRPELLDNIEYDTYGAENANEYLNKMMDFAVNGCRYVAIINDSITNMTSAAVNWSLGFRKSGKGSSADKDKIMPDFDEYKIETSLVTQALDLGKKLSTNVIWTAHPLPSIKIEGKGVTMKVTKTNPIVTYGSKVAGIIPGNFTEIYHFLQDVTWDPNGKSTKKFLVSMESSGDEFAKSAIGLTGELDITNKLFYTVWKEAINKLNNQNKENQNDVAKPAQSGGQTYQWKP